MLLKNPYLNVCHRLINDRAHALMNLSELARRELEETSFLWEMKSSRQEEEGVKPKKEKRKKKKLLRGRNMYLEGLTTVSQTELAVSLNVFGVYMDL